MSSKTMVGVSLVMMGLLTCVAGAGELAPNSGSLNGNLSLWLRMPEINYDPGTGIWTDLSPKGNDAVAIDGFVGPTLSTGENAAVFAQPFSTAHFDPAAKDLLKAVNLNNGSGLTELTIFHVLKVVATGGVDQRGVGFGSYQDGGIADTFNPSFDMTLRKNNGSIAGKNQDLPLDQYVIYAARMNPSSINMWLNTTGTLELAFTSSGSSFATGTDLFYVGDMRYSPAGDFDIAEVIVFNSALTDTEVEGVCEWLQTYVGRVAKTVASGGTPGDASNDVSRDVTLSWSPVVTAVKRDVYFGSSFEDVNTATVPTAAGLDVNDFNPGRLDFGATYFWRVDEVNGAPDNTVFKGDVWSFEVEPYSIQIAGSQIIATASSYANDASMPGVTLDGSGMGDDNAHGIATETMWFTAMGDMDPWIQYEFEEVKKLDTMKVWNSNSAAEGFIGYGVKGVVIEYSKDGQTWEVFEDANEFSRAPGLPTYNQYDEIVLGGVAAKMVRLNIQSNFGGVLQSYSLSEVQSNMIPTVVRTPVPASGVVGIAPDEILSWRAGREAAQSTVYLGTDANDVENGAAPSSTSNTNSINLSAFDITLGETYYWRVDEVNEAEAESVWAGPVWSFSTVAALVVEDFESYGNDSPDRPFQAWLDGFGYSADEFFPAGYGGNGTGAGIGHDIWSVASPYYNGNIMETTKTIAGSGQSMPFYYSNTGGVASQTERTFAVPQDWTVGGAKTLSIAFSGQAGNMGSLYVKINNTKLVYGGDPENLTLGVWQAWNIDLSSMNVQNVTKLQIGVEGNGAAGIFYIDDIRLYAQPGQVIIPVVPDTASLVAYYSFDGNAQDASGNNRHGTTVGGPLFVPGAVGQALEFDGVDDYVNIDGYKGINADHSDPNNPAQQPFTISNWVKTTSETGDTEMVTWGLQGTGTRLTWRIHEGRLRTEHNAGNLRGNTYVNDGEWHHIALVITKGATLRPDTTHLYVDGFEDTYFSGGDTAFNLTADSDVRIGMSGPHEAAAAANVRYFLGALDEVRIYDRALSAAEIAGLAGKINPIHLPF